MLTETGRNLHPTILDALDISGDGIIIGEQGEIILEVSCNGLALAREVPAPFRDTNLAKLYTVSSGEENINPYPLPAKPPVSTHFEINFPLM